MPQANLRHVVEKNKELISEQQARFEEALCC
jgi:hypothetical protein